MALQSHSTQCDPSLCDTPNELWSHDAITRLALCLILESTLVDALFNLWSSANIEIAFCYQCSTNYFDYDHNIFKYISSLILYVEDKELLIFWQSSFLFPSPGCRWYQRRNEDRPVCFVHAKTARNVTQRISKWQTMSEILLVVTIYRKATSGPWSR